MHTVSRLAAHYARGLHLHLPSRNQRAQGRPGACCTLGLACDLRKQKCTRAYRAAGTLRPSLRNGFTAYFVLFPENGFLASVVSGTLPANLTPAPRRPNHTTSPYASRTLACARFASIASHRTFVTIASAPQLGETGGVMGLIWVRTKAEYFYAKAWTDFW